MNSDVGLGGGRAARTQCTKLRSRQNVGGMADWVDGWVGEGCRGRRPLRFGMNTRRTFVYLIPSPLHFTSPQRLWARRAELRRRRGTNDECGAVLRKTEKNATSASASVAVVRPRTNEAQKKKASMNEFKDGGGKNGEIRRREREGRARKKSPPRLLPRAMQRERIN